MSLALLLYPPPTARGFDEWAFANLQHHRRINLAIARQRGVDLPTTQIYPVRPDSFKDFLRQHQEWHDAINNELGIQGVDLSNVDMSKEKERDAFIWLHFNAHRNWAEALGQGV